MEIECVEGALKTSIRKELAMKLSPQVFMEKCLSFNMQNIAPFDDFSVNDLLDFSHKEALIEEQQKEEQDEHKVVSVVVSICP